MSENMQSPFDVIDAGEGYELIDKENSVKKPGDEYLDPLDGWRPAGMNVAFQSGLTYRRRIKQAKPSF